MGSDEIYTDEKMTGQYALRMVCLCPVGSNRAGNRGWLRGYLLVIVKRLSLKILFRLVLCTFIKNNGCKTENNYSIITYVVKKMVLCYRDGY